MDRTEDLSTEKIRKAAGHSILSDPGSFYRDVLDHLPTCIVVTDADGYFRYANTAYWKTMKIPPEALLGRHQEDIIGDKRFYQTSHALQAIKTQTYFTTVALNNSYGDHKFGHVTCIPVFNENQKLKFVITSISNPYDMRQGYEEFKSAMEEADLIRIIKSPDANNHELLLGETPEIQEIRKRIKRVAETNATVLITGESGCGKEVVADSIYDSCSRQDKPFVKINCTAIPPDLLESELFGYEKGAFTGANSKGKIGLLEAANYGTVLLDEIGDFPLHLQPKLLRVLQQGTMFRIGSTTPVNLDIRFIAATNCDLKKKVQEGTFRQDLYYRLMVFPINVPPLRDRSEDIPSLAYKFLDQCCQQYGKTVTLPKAALPLFQQHNWPGNVRELINVIEYLVICTDDGMEITVRDIKSLLGTPELPTTYPHQSGTLFERRDRFEKKVIEDSILETGNLRETARQLGVYISSLYRKIEKYDIHTAELIARSKENKY